MGRMRQMTIERVDAVDEPATGARWIIAKRSGQAGDATPTLEELAKAAIGALSKDAELSISDEAGEALSALAGAVELELKLEKDEDEAEAEKAAEEPESDESDEDDEDEADEAEESAESDEDESDDDESDEADESDEDESVEKRLDTLERGVELILEKLDGKGEEQPKQKSRRRASKQAAGQDDLSGDTRQLNKSGKGEGGKERISYADVLFNQ